MKRFDLWGSSSLTTEEVAFSLEDALSIYFVEHDSSYLGIYFLFALDGEEIRVQRNEPDDEGYLPERGFPHCQTLVYVNGSSRWEDLDAAFRAAGLELLRSKTV